MSQILLIKPLPAFSIDPSNTCPHPTFDDLNLIILKYVDLITGP
ncbi:hypothetical protein [Desulfolucanica intricata]|nr:hypothetical protein [Desulfolucanica intricata]